MRGSPKLDLGFQFEQCLNHRHQPEFPEDARIVVHVPTLFVTLFFWFFLALMLERGTQPIILVGSEF